MANEFPDWISYDAATETLIVSGHKVSAAFLEQITVSPPGIRFRIIERKDGAITVGTERDPLEAAAPDMLSALKEAQRVLVQTAADPTHPIVRQVVSAIAKAEGRA